MEIMKSEYSIIPHSIKKIFSFLIKYFLNRKFKKIFFYFDKNGKNRKRWKINEKYHKAKN